jgi:hypothetical protein
MQPYRGPTVGARLCRLLLSAHIHTVAAPLADRSISTAYSRKSDIAPLSLDLFPKLCPCSILTEYTFDQAGGGREAEAERQRKKRPSLVRGAYASAVPSLTCSASSPRWPLPRVTTFYLTFL